MGTDRVVPPISYPQCNALDAPIKGPTIRSAPWFAEADRGDYDFVVPRSSFNDAVELLKTHGEVIDAVSAGVVNAGKSGELYLDLINVSVIRFERTIRDIGEEVRKTQTYTPEMAERIINARRAMLKELRGITPLGTYFKIEPDYPELFSAKKTERLAKRLEALTERGAVSSRSFRSIVKGAKKQAPSAENYIKTSSSYAKALKNLGGFVEIIQISPDINRFLTTDDPEEYKKSLSHLAGAGAGALVSRAAPFLCIGFGVATGGFGLLACGIAVNVVAGTILTDFVELQTKKVLDQEIP